MNIKELIVDSSEYFEKFNFYKDRIEELVFTSEKEFEETLKTIQMSNSYSESQAVFDKIQNVLLPFLNRCYCNEIQLSDRLRFLMNRFDNMGEEFIRQSLWKQIKNNELG